MNLLVDTSAYSRFMKDDLAAMAVASRLSAAVMNPITLGELRAGFLNGSRLRQNEQHLARFIAGRHVIDTAITAATASIYATLVAQLRLAGRPLPTTDIWIAALAIELNLAIWTYDRQFDSIVGIRIIRTTQDMETL